MPYNLLIVSPWLPHETICHAGGQHLYHTIRTLIERGLRVHVLCYGRNEHTKQVESVATLCTSLTIVTPAYTWQQKLMHFWQTGWRRPWLLGRRTHTLMRAYLHSLCQDHQIDVVQFAWTEMGRYIHAVPEGVGVVLGTLDAEYVVRPRELALYSPGWAHLRGQQRVKHLIRLEQRAVRRAHVILACSAHDRDALLRLNPAASIVIVPPWIGFSAHVSIDADQVVPGRLVFMGALDRLANYAVAQWLLREVWPHIRRSSAKTTLRIVGANPPAALCAAAAEDTRLTVTGFVPDLVAEWHSTDVAVCPSLIGGGLLIKVAQPLWLGRPVITTERGNEGTAALVGTAIDVADNGRAFAAAVVRLLNDRAHWQQRALAGQAYARTAFDWQANMDRLESAYDQAMLLAQSS